MQLKIQPKHYYKYKGDPFLFFHWKIKKGQITITTMSKDVPPAGYQKTKTGAKTQSMA